MFGGGHPDLKVSAKWDDASAQLELNILQQQKKDDLTAIFRLPVKVQFVWEGGEEIRAKVAKGGSETDITRDRLVRETLLSRIFESQLAITVSALDRFQTGEGRYPLDMVRGLQAVSAMFEKTSLQTVATAPMQNDLFEREVERRESVVYQDAKNRVLAGERVPKEVPDEHCQPKADFGGHTSFFFGQGRMEGWMYNNRMRQAWEDGVRDGKAEKKLEVEDVQSEA